MFPIRSTQGSLLHASTRLFTIVLFVLVFAHNGWALERQTISWLYFNFPPLYVKNDLGVSGYGMEIIKQLQKSLPEYNHTYVQASPGRMEIDLAEGKHVVVLGIFKTPERKKTMNFSQSPCRLSMGNVIAMRSKDAFRLAPGGTASVIELLNDQHMNFAHLPKVTYGKLQPIMKKHLDEARSIGIPNVSHLLTMIQRKRVDWAVLESFNAAYHRKEAGVADAISLLRIKEQPTAATPGFVVTPKTIWGRLTMNRINDALRAMVDSGELHRILAQYVPKQMMGDFDREYERLISDTHY